MDEPEQSNYGAACLDNRYRSPEILDQKPLILLNLNGVETSTNAQNAQVEESLLCAGGVHEPDP